MKRKRGEWKGKGGDDEQRERGWWKKRRKRWWDRTETKRNKERLKFISLIYIVYTHTLKYICIYIYLSLSLSSTNTHSSIGPSSSCLLVCLLGLFSLSRPSSTLSISLSRSLSLCALAKRLLSFVILCCLFALCLSYSFVFLLLVWIHPRRPLFCSFLLFFLFFTHKKKVLSHSKHYSLIRNTPQTPFPLLIIPPAHTHTSPRCANLAPPSFRV